ncbi:MAG: CoA pyrophosphatase [Flavobacteriaceae bacterium]|nr:CoA pyrophosphatase [Flavobacteriaceae bacterium]
MEFNSFKKALLKVQTTALPGEEIQLKMAPKERLQELKNLAQSQKNASKAGVMALFYPNMQQETHLILILRKTYKGVHSGQVGFPGGRFEIQDKDLTVTALRETEEEIGVPRGEIQVVKKLTEMYIPPSNFVVQPFMGFVEKYPQFKAQPSEVEALIEIPLTHFLNDDVIIKKSLTTSYAIDIEVPAYYLKNHVVWGATAMILSEVRHLLKAAL